jgi:hypothetical protein
MSEIGKISLLAIFVPLYKNISMSRACCAVRFLQATERTATKHRHVLAAGHVKKLFRYLTSTKLCIKIVEKYETKIRCRS